MRKEITEAQITELMRAIPRAEEVDRLSAENEKLRAEIEAIRRRSVECAEMSRDDPPEETENQICILFFDTQICVDENGAVSVYTGASNDESDDGFRVVATARSVIGDYFDSVRDIERRLREWADENGDRIDACIRHAKEIASMSARKDAEIERLRADLATQQGCCDGAAAQDAHIRREREEHRAQIERLREALLDIESGDYSDPMCWRIRQRAREALEGES